MDSPYAHTPEDRQAPESLVGKHDRHDCEIYKKSLRPCKSCLPSHMDRSDIPAPMCADPVQSDESKKTTKRLVREDSKKMPEPTGKYAEVPEGWPPQTWGMHLARIEFMEELGQGHYSRTDAAWHVKRFKARILEEERLRVLRVLREMKVSNAAVEMQIYPTAEK